MASFQFKSISKVIVDKLASIAPNLISLEQRGFVKDRSIDNYICVTSKAFNMLN